MHATISILSHNASNYAAWCLDNLKLHTDSKNCRLLLTANGPDSVGVFEKFKEATPFIETTIIKNPENMGFIEPNREALRLTYEKQSDVFIMLNDDALVGPGWLDTIFSAFDKDPMLAVAGPSGSRLNNSFLGGQRGDPIEYVEGCCLAVRTSLAKRHGLFDPKLEWAYGEDSDLSLTFRSLGYRIKRLNFPFAHIGSVTTKSLRSAKAAQHFQENHKYLAQKWSDYLKTGGFKK